MAQLEKSIERLSKMLDICERRAREPVDSLVDYPTNSVNNDGLQRAANYAILASEYRHQLNDLLIHEGM